MSRPLHFVDSANDKKNAKRDNKKIDHQRDEVPVVPRDRAGFERVRRRVEHGRAIFRGLEHDELVREIEPARQQTDRRHDNVFDQGGDDRTERSADDHSDSQINRVSFDGKFFEFFPHATILYLTRRDVDKFFGNHHDFANGFFGNEFSYFWICEGGRFRFVFSR